MHSVIDRLMPLLHLQKRRPPPPRTPTSREQDIVHAELEELERQLRTAEEAIVTADRRKRVA